MSDEWENSLMGKEDNESVLELLEIISFEVNNFIDSKRNKMTPEKINYTLNSAFISIIKHFMLNMLKNTVPLHGFDAMMHKFNLVFNEIMHSVGEDFINEDKQKH
jgi:hypothetical protein